MMCGSFASSFGGSGGTIQNLTNYSTVYQNSGDTYDAPGGIVGGSFMDNGIYDSLVNYGTIRGYYTAGGICRLEPQQ